MSEARANNLSREKLQQLLGAIGSRPAEDSAQIEAAEYNWHQPHYFNRSQLNKLDDFVQGTGKAIARKFSALCPGEFNVEIVSASQHFANEIVGQALDAKQNDYYLAFGTDPANPCGFLGIPTKTAFIWTAHLLGDTESGQESRENLSTLEESLLLDIATAVVEALCDSHKDCNFQPAKNIARRLLPLQLDGTEELCKVTFSVKKTGSGDTEVYFLVYCKSLEPVVGKADHVDEHFTAQDISRATLGHMQEVSVTVTARLAATTLTLDELMELQPDDILLLDKKVDEPIELIIDSRTVFRGRPAKSQGCYAALITELCRDME
jgi:flagellar motor switch protein FliM